MVYQGKGRALILNTKKRYKFNSKLKDIHANKKKHLQFIKKLHNID